MSTNDEEEQRERYMELLQELRVMIPGVEVLFAFLLTSVFSSRFAELDSTGRDLFTTALVSSAVTILLFLSPAALHRISDDDRATRVRIAVRLSLAGSATLAVAMTSAMFVVIRFLYDGPTATVLAGATLFVLVALWYLFPIMRRVKNDAN